MPLIRIDTLYPGYIRTGAGAELLQRPGMETRCVSNNTLYGLNTGDEFASRFSS